MKNKRAKQKILFFFFGLTFGLLTLEGASEARTESKTFSAGKNALRFLQLFHPHNINDAPQGATITRVDYQASLTCDQITQIGAAAFVNFGVQLIHLNGGALISGTIAPLFDPISHTYRCDLYSPRGGVTGLEGLSVNGDYPFICQNNCDNIDKIKITVTYDIPDNGFGIPTGIIPRGSSGASPRINSDTDHDGVTNKNDNCPSQANSNQLDTEGDGSGNACDDDDDNDGLNDMDETARGSDPLKNDTDGDGVNDGTEVSQGRNPVVNEGVVLSLISLILNH